jgi:D-lactate dehydrogenase (cytochrome)
VLPNGRVFDGLRGLRKDNTGYDLKQLFIGAEGTLGFITAAVCKLFPLPRSTATALLAVDGPRAAVDLFARAQLRLGDELTAIEIFPRLALEMVLAHIDGCRNPLDKAWDWYLLIEIAGARDQADTDQNLTGFLDDCLERAVVRDGVIAQSGKQRADLWRLRHSISEAQRHVGASIKNDISVPVARVAEFIDEATRYAAERLPGVRPVPFGHLGDGNIHFNLSQPEAMASQEFLDLWGEITAAIHTIAVQLGGSFSAEHGIGSLKTGELVRLRSDVELGLMRAIKQAVDPHGIMNPGKVLER